MSAIAPGPPETLLCEISHPSASETVRLADGGGNFVFGGNTYLGTRFDARLVNDEEQQMPRAEFRFANIGRALSDWLNETGGGQGATITLRAVGASGAVVWEVTLDVLGSILGDDGVRAQLGYDLLLGRPAVTERYDPETVPGLF